MNAYSRAWKFLGYKPLAKWSALTAAVVSSVLYLAFLCLLGLFADLLVHRGRIPTLAELTAGDRDEFLQAMAALSPEEKLALLDTISVEGRHKDTASTEPAKLPPERQEWLWRAHIHRLLEPRVDPAAAALVVPAAGTEYLNSQDLADRGVLSLVVRAHERLYSPLIDGVAALNPWMWQPGENSPNYFHYLTGLLIVGLILALIHAFSLYVLNASAALATIEASTRLRRAVYHHTHRLGRLAFRSLGPAEAVGIFTKQLETLHNGLYVGLTVMVREPFKFALLLAFALVVNFWLSLAFLCFALLVWLVGGQVAVYFIRQERNSTREAADELSLLQESLMMTRVVKVYLMELFNQSRVERQLSRYARAQWRRYRGEAIYRPLLIFLGALAAVVLLYVAGLIVLSGELGVASSITLAVALVSLYLPLIHWLEQRRLMRRAREAADILFAFLDRPGEVGQAAGAEFLPPLAKTLEFDDVSLQEPGTGRKLLQSVTLSVQHGQKVGIVGPDELQKHALVYLLPRFLDPTSGEIRIDKKNLRWVTIDSLRSQIAMVLQHNLVFNDTVANNISCGDARFDLPKIIEAAKLAHAHHFIHKLPKGYETQIGEMGHHLGIGAQFRIAIARAILRNPSILVIEEPTVALDEDTKAMIDDTFQRVMAGRTVIFLPHRISTIRKCDKIFLLHKGKIEASGEHRELITQSELYKHLHYIEFNEIVEEILG
ncbi:MAG: ABC transporter ATP-binding protein [Gemmataceae bacterium]